MKIDHFEFYNAKKEISVSQPKWIGGQRQSLTFTVPLSVNGTSVGGYALIGNTKIDIPNRDVVLLIVHTVPSIKGKGINLGRAEWRPLSGHNNKSRGPQLWQNVEIKCSHVHDFYDNIKWAEDLWIERKLPIALPIEPEPKTYSEFLGIVGDKFNISNISSIPEPPWDVTSQRELF
jgi:hypothetical protein